MFLAAAAQVTRHARLITGAVLPAFNNPLKVAGELAMLDALSDRRAECGFARAFLPHEFTRFGVPLDESRARFDEGVEQVRRLLEEENVTSEGRFHSFRNVTSLPRPTQTPRPPFYVAAPGARESFEREYLKIQIRRFSGNISRTASFIGMERSALHRKLKALGLGEKKEDEQ